MALDLLEVHLATVHKIVAAFGCWRRHIVAVQIESQSVAIRARIGKGKR